MRRVRCKGKCGELFTSDQLVAGKCLACRKKKVKAEARQKSLLKDRPEPKVGSKTWVAESAARSAIAAGLEPPEPKKPARKVKPLCNPPPAEIEEDRPSLTQADLANNLGQKMVVQMGAKVVDLPQLSSLTDRLRGSSFQRLLAQRRAEIDLDTFQAHGRTPTPEQRAALDGALQGPAVLVLEAGAGTGKTSTFQMLAQVLPGNGQYCSFGKAQTDDAKPKFAGTKVAVNTTHSLAFRAVGFQFADRLGGRRVRADEVARMLGLGEFKLAVEVQQKDGSRVRSERALAPGFLAGQVMGAVRRWCQGADREITAEHFKYIDGIDLPDATGRRTYDNNRKVAEYLVPYARKARADLSDPKGQLPYWPDCYVKLWQLSDPVIAADYILCDEAQDSAEVWLDIMRQQLGPSRKSNPMLILCGDSAQQIYAWRGAVNAMASFPDAPRLFLSQSFRFGEAIAQAANAVLETLENGTPLRLKGLPSIPSKLEPLADPSCVLCRTNAAAVASLLGGIAAGKSPYLVGGGADVLAFCEAVRDLQAGRPTSHPDLGCFGSWAEVEKYVEDDEGEDLRLWVKLVNAFGAQKIHDAVKNMPKEKDASFVICTAHKSKGREWDTVKLASDFPTNDRATDEERRLLYVAVTRGKLIVDVSECPFFTGEGCVDLTAAVIAGARDQEHASSSVIPATPAVAPQAEAPEEKFTWSKGRNGDWLIRGPAHRCKEQVKVYRRDGSFQTILLAETVWQDKGIALYKKGSDRPQLAASSTAQSHRAVCAECGKPGFLVHDLEDGMLKHRQCCDIEP